MSKEDLIIYGLIFFSGLFVTLFEVYRCHNRIWKLKRQLDRNLEAERAEMYRTACNTFSLNCKYMLKSNVIKAPEDWKGTDEELFYATFINLVPEAKEYIKIKEASNDVQLENSDGVPEART